LNLSFLFYEAQQSGKLPDWNRLRWDKQPDGWRRDAHLNEGQPIGKVRLLGLGGLKHCSSVWGCRALADGRCLCGVG